MSALAAVFGPGAGSAGAVLPAMFAAMRHRASAPPESCLTPTAALAAARHSWESGVSGWHGPLIAESGDWVVVADASLYYVAELCRKLGVQRGHGQPETGQLLLMALRKWDTRFARHVEGDYAIVAWDRRRDRVLMARDFGGRRNLAWARTSDGSLVVASSPAAVVKHPQVSSDYDPVFLAASAAGISAHGYGTAYREVSVVPAGGTLQFVDGRALLVDRWDPPPFGSGWESSTSAAAAEQLRSLLQDAARERLADDAPTTVWMSGGWDSTAVFASAAAALESEHSGRPLLPVSMTYPADDTGNEDAHIRAVADRWNVPIRWVQADDIPLFEDTANRALLRDDPMAQPFESKMRHLSRVSRTLGSRVALDGFGGDHLFLVSSAAITADHFFSGRWSQLYGEWRGWPGSAREFARLSVLPHLSPSTRRWLGSLRGRPIAGFWDRFLPPWLQPRAEVVRMVEPELERQPGEGAAEYESRKGIVSPFVARAVSWNHSFALEEGVLVRAPLFDTRVIAFACGRPLSDRGGGGDSKRILRHAMKGLLPDSVLAPRPRKTGTPAGYFRRQMQAHLMDEVAAVFGGSPGELERLGILDAGVFRQAVEQYAGSGEHALGAMLQLTLEVERWLAARSARG